MQAKKSKSEDLRAMRWPQEQWEFLGNVARAAGLTRSELVRTAAMAHAANLAAGLPYSVGVTPQNTAANRTDLSRAKQGAGQGGLRRSRTRSSPEGISGPIPEELGRDGVTNVASEQAERPRSLRS